MEKHFQLSAYDYHLPEENIALHPADRRDQSRLLVLDCAADTMAHRRFADITELLHPGDLLVVNNTRVFPARMFGAKESGGKVEILLLHYPVTREAPEGSGHRHAAEVLPEIAARVCSEALARGVILLLSGDAADVLSITPPLPIGEAALIDALDLVAERLR